MSAIRFYRRYEEDGRCRVICLQCFETLGTAGDRASVEAMERGHVCGGLPQKAPDAVESPAFPEPAARRGAVPELLRMPVGWLVLLTVAGVYLLPTAAELAARHALNPWLAVIVPGDVVGCAVLAGVLRRPRTGILLYLGLTALEGCVYAAGMTRAHQLAWFADLVPTLVLLTLILRMKGRGGGLKPC